MNIEFDSGFVYGVNDKYIKKKIKSQGDSVNTNFQGKKIARENPSCIMSVTDNVRFCY